MFDLTTNKNKEIKTFAILSYLVLSLIVNAQIKDRANDSALLDSFIQSKGYGSAITFSSANIKQFWVDKSVVSQDSLIKILVEESKSIPYKIQLANVSIMQDCKVDIISNNPDLRFSILNNDSKIISESEKEDNFINYNIASASFHIDNTNNFSFYLQFSSSKDEIDIIRIILSFSDNKYYLASPGKLIISESNCTAPNIVKTDGDNSFSVKAKNIILVSNSRIYVSDNTISNSISVKNIGKSQAVLSIGYAPYTKNGKIIDNRNSPYKSNKILKVVSAPTGRNTITVDSEPEWTKGCYLALDAKEDLSDFPNHSWVDGTIQDVKKIDDNHFEILFSKPNQKEIKAGTLVRVQSPAGATYLYTKTHKLLPGEEVTLSSDTQKDDTYLRFGSKFCRGTYYVVPILISHSPDYKENNALQITNYTVSY